MLPELLKSRRSSGPTNLIFPVAYSVILSLWWVASLSVGDKWWWLFVLNRFAPGLFVPALILFAQGLVYRRRAWLAACFIPAGIFLFLYWPYLLPRPAVTEMVDLRVMTYNVLVSNTDYDAIASAILSHQPGLVALQEVHPGMMTELVARLEREYPYWQMATFHRNSTTAVLSRYPLQEAKIIELGWNRAAVVVEADVNGQAVTFISAHLLAYGLQWYAWHEIPAAILERTQLQNQQAQMLVREVQQREGTVIMGCDCNATEISTTYRILEQAFMNTARVSGRSADKTSLEDTKPDRNLLHIDYIFFRGPLLPLGTYVAQDSGGSDHLPVLTRFSFENRQP